MNKRALFFIFVLGMAALNLGSVRQTDDPVRDTQTNPILYKQKMEEEKDGKKGPLLYHVQNSPRETFFIDPPFEKEKKDPSKEIVTEKTSSSTDTTGWWEEQSTTPSKVPPAETVSEPLPEPLPEAEKVRDHEAVGQPAATPEAEKAPDGKGDDTWW